MPLLRRLFFQPSVVVVLLGAKAGFIMTEPLKLVFHMHSSCLSICWAPKINDPEVHLFEPKSAGFLSRSVSLHISQWQEVQAFKRFKLLLPTAPLRIKSLDTVIGMSSLPGALILLMMSKQINY